MIYTARNLSSIVDGAARHLPALVVTGPRRAGKTTLLRRSFPRARYILLEDPDTQARVRNDPRAFLDGLRPPVIFDEIQNVPELPDYVRTLIDAKPRRTGQWLFTGSQEAPLMRGITESIAGCAVACAAKALDDRAKRLAVVQRRPSTGVATTAIAPGAEALDIDQFVAELNP